MPAPTSSSSTTAATAAAAVDAALTSFPTIFRLDNKVAVVTGSSRGLGLHAASGLLQAGCATVFVTSRKAAACAAACEALNALPNLSPGARAVPVAADLRSAAGAAALAAEVGRHVDAVDVLVANAGATWGAALEDVTEESWDRVADLNVRGVFFTVQKMLPLLLAGAARGGAEDPARVVVTGSVAGVATGSVGGGNATHAYSASKAGALHLARNLAAEFAGRNILVNGIAPGFFPSKMADGIIEKLGGREEVGKASPNGRVGRAEDVAATVVWLCSRGGSHVNAATIVLDGGKIWGRSKL